MVKNLPAPVRDERDAGSIPESGRSPRGKDNLLQYSYLENSMDRVAWRATVHRVTQSQTGLKPLSSSKKFYILINIPHDSEAHG